MGKYSEIVKGKNQSGKPENQKAINTESNQTGNVESSKSGEPENIITSNVENIKTDELENQKAVNTKSNQTGNLQNSITGKPENQKTEAEDMVNLSIKVPRRLRQKWVAESRLRGTTLTAIISEYLKAELGE